MLTLLCVYYNPQEDYNLTINLWAVKYVFNVFHLVFKYSLIEQYLVYILVVFS